MLSIFPFSFCCNSLSLSLSLSMSTAMFKARRLSKYFVTRDAISRSLIGRALNPMLTRVELALLDLILGVMCFPCVHLLRINGSSWRTCRRNNYETCTHIELMDMDARRVYELHYDKDKWRAALSSLQLKNKKKKTNLIDFFTQLNYEVLFYLKSLEVRGKHDKEDISMQFTFRGVKD